MKPIQLNESEINFLKSTTAARLDKILNDPKRKAAQDETYLFALEFSEKMKNSTVVFVVQNGE